MQNDEYIVSRKSDGHVNVSQEKFKKMAFEIIERKDKLINMLYGILEMVGVTNLSIKEIMSRYSNSSKNELIENGVHRLMNNKKNISPRKRLRLDVPNYRSPKKKRILNIFSTPQNVYEPIHTDKNLAVAIPSRDKKLLSPTKKEVTNNQHKINDFSKTKNYRTDFDEPIRTTVPEAELQPETETSHQQGQQQREQEQKKELKEQELQKLQKLQQQLIDARNGKMLSARKHNLSVKQSSIDYQIRARENLEVQGCKSECSNEDSDTQKTLNSEINDNSVESTEEEEKEEEQEKEKEEEKKEKKKEEKKEAEEETCYVCLMPMRESLIGSFPPSQYKLRCGHVFHLKCLYEVVRRRNIRQTCCTCQEILNDKDKQTIIEKIKLEKKEHQRRSKSLLKILHMQAHEK